MTQVFAFFKIHFQLVNAMFYLMKTFLFKFFSLSSKSGLLRNLATSLLLAKFAYVNLSSKVSTVYLLNSGAVIYLL